VNKYIWNPYEVGDTEAYIAMERWGKDHWSLLAYVETRAVDHQGILNGDHMRTNLRLHREMQGDVQYRRGMGSSEHSTRLKSEYIDNHDDWSCLEDLIAAGLITAETAQIYFNRMFANTIARIKLTEKGQVMAEQLRRHKTNGDNFSNFEPQQEVA